MVVAPITLRDVMLASNVASRVPTAAAGYAGAVTPRISLDVVAVMVAVLLVVV